MQAKNVAILAGVGVVVGVASYFGYKEWKKPGSPLRRLTGSLGMQASDCTLMCTNDPACKAAVYNKLNGSCTLHQNDPYVNAQEDPNSILFIRRDSSTPASSWGEWTPDCPAGCGDSMDQHRTCTGKCPGADTKTCVRPKCDHWERYPSGYNVDLQDRDSMSISSAKNAQECENSCLTWSKDGNTCKAWNWVTAGWPACNIWVTNKLPDTLNWGDVYAHGDTTATAILLPGEGNGEWGPLPDGAKECKCGGPVELQRPCLSGDCKVGIRKVKCPTSMCQYDRFEGYGVA